MKLDLELLSVFTFVCIITFRTAESVINSEPHQNLALQNQNHKSSGLVPKASFTQKGYIQFLRYVVDVPEITEYTFCIWMRSNNLTHNHPLLSYSKHEEERLIRVWVSPLGSSINLEILEVPIFSVPVHFVEHKWYHICQSWSSGHAAWSLYINGILKSTGFTPKLKGVPIKSEGDLVVGQEYTDFDKGLDDGIEGDISGFNLVLASTFEDTNTRKHPIESYVEPNAIFKRNVGAEEEIFSDPFFREDKLFEKAMLGDQEKTHTRRQIWDESLEVFKKYKLIPPLPLENVQHPLYQHHMPTSYQTQLYHQINEQIPIPIELLVNKPTLGLRDYIHKPLGLLLVQLSNDCGYLRGAPLSGKGVLVSWTKTNVRVFGGAILKSVPAFCKK